MSESRDADLIVRFKIDGAISGATEALAKALASDSVFEVTLAQGQALETAGSRARLPSREDSASVNLRDQPDGKSPGRSSVAAEDTVAAAAPRGRGRAGGTSGAPADSSRGSDPDCQRPKDDAGTRVSPLYPTAADAHPAVGRSALRLSRRPPRVRLGPTSARGRRPAAK